MVTVEIRRADGSFKSYEVASEIPQHPLFVDDMATAEEKLRLKREPNEVLKRIMGRANRISNRSRRRHVKVAVYEEGRFIGWRAKYAMTHKRGQPSGRKPRRDIVRETIRHMQPTDPQTFEFELWLVDELPLPDMGMISHHALEVEEAMIFAAEYNDDDMYVQEIMLPLEELIAA